MSGFLSSVADDDGIHAHSRDVRPTLLEQLDLPKIIIKPTRYCLVLCQSFEFRLPMFKLFHAFSFGVETSRKRGAPGGP